MLEELNYYRSYARQLHAQLQNLERAMNQVFVSAASAEPYIVNTDEIRRILNTYGVQTHEIDYPHAHRSKKPVPYAASAVGRARGRRRKAAS